MSVIRTFHDKEHPYTILANEVLYDTSLSNAARGLWAQCMRRPENWEFHITEMVKHGKDGRHAIYSQIRELIEAGYALRIQVRKENPQKKLTFAGVEYVFFEKKLTPEKKALFLEEFKKCFPHSGFPYTENQTLLNKEEPLSTDSLSVKSIVVEEAKPVDLRTKKAAPPGANNKVPDCLKECEKLTPAEKRQFAKYPSEIVQAALKYVSHAKTRLDGRNAFVRQMHAFCKDPESYRESYENLDKPQGPSSIKEKILSRLKKGESYNGYTFEHDKWGLIFYSATGYEVLKARWNEIEAITAFLKGTGIDVGRNE